MISSVNSVGFKGAAVSTHDPMGRPGKYTTMPKETVQKEKSHKAAKWITGLAATAIAVGALLVVGKNKNLFKNLSADELQKAGIMDKCSHWVGKAAEFVDTKCWQPLKNLPAKISDWWATRGAKA